MSGYKDFVAGDPLTAAQVDGYLMRQSVMVFASAAARDAALSGVLVEGMHAYTSDTDTLWFYSGSAWRADALNYTTSTNVTLSRASASLTTTQVDLVGTITITSAPVARLVTFCCAILPTTTGSYDFYQVGQNTSNRVRDYEGTSVSASFTEILPASTAFTYKCQVASAAGTITLGLAGGGDLNYLTVSTVPVG